MKSLPSERYEGNIAGLILALYALNGTAIPIGFTRKGKPIWPIAGGDGTQSVEAQIAELTSAIRKLADVRVEANPAGKAADGGRYAAAVDGSKSISDQLVEATRELASLRAATDKATAAEAMKAQVSEAVKAVLSDMRMPSMARLIGQGTTPDATTSRRNEAAVLPGHAALKASFRDYQAGELLTAIMDVKNLGDGIDIDRAIRGKAALMSLGLVYAEGVPSLSKSYSVVDGSGKATLGATGATGGYVLPNNLVDTVIKPHTQVAVYQNLITVRNGVNVRGVDQPYHTGAPARMQFQDWGATKENVNEAYGSYTANLGTMARIMDIGKQYARFSAGSAEQDVMDELTRAAILGENYYILAGAGTGSVGSGDPTTGVYTALAALFGAYTTAHTAVATTVAGSAAAGLAASFRALATRSRVPTAVITDAVTYWTMFSQGSDNAGFWMSEMLGAGFQISPDNSLRWRGVPILYDANFDTNTGTTKRAIVGEWAALKMYRGMEFRIDSSDVAGTRWDTNEIGFRGEQEIGVNAYSAVLVGAFQLITGLIP